MVHSFVSVITRHWVSLVGSIIALVALVMILLLIIPLLLTVVTSFGQRDPDGNVLELTEHRNA
jgi:ABC-type spermidine/putrescine transport system permease subunit II